MSKSRFASWKSLTVGAMLSLTAAFAVTPAAAHDDHNSGPSQIGSQGSVGVGGYLGTVSGAASSISSGGAVAAAQVNGYGSSFQGTGGISGGTATVGGVVTGAGATVITGTTQIAVVQSYGNVTGNAPINVGDNMIANGTGGIAKSDNYAGGNSAFQLAQFGGYAGYQVTPIYPGR